ncbi:hypothetical protein D3C80_930870 [compost metagenome]
MQGQQAVQRGLDLVASQLGLGQRQMQAHVQLRSTERWEGDSLQQQTAQRPLCLDVAALPQPEAYPGQQRQPLVQVGADLVVLHQPLGIGDACEGARYIALQGAQLGQPQMPPDGGGVGTGQAFPQARHEGRLGVLVAAALQQQARVLQQGAPAHGAGLGAPG